MLPEIGQYSLILSLFFALSLSCVPLIGYWQNSRLLLAMAKPLTFIVSVLIFIGFGVLCFSFISDDFSIAYVSQNSNSLLPVYYKFSAVWGGHEGSLLLWVLILSGWCSAVAYRIESLPEDIGPVVLAVLGMVSSGFLAFLIFTSSPFIRLLPDIPVDGGDLNPLLQDIGLIIHPPVLYMGYVGFAVAFAFAVTALITGRLDAAWARWARPWTAASWACLTLGITLGSWWAYYELGWGGWWFWDPVENASLMPWLAGTALLHSLAVTEKRGVFKSWTVLLAIFTFCLSLLGAFLVRSGVLTSVHSFAADPTRGLFILALLTLFAGGSLFLYGLRAYQVRSSVSFGVTGREAWLLLNNIFLTVLTLTVLLGTLYPLLFDALGLGKISVGAPYFNAVVVPIALLLIVFMGVGPLSKWHHTPLKHLFMPCMVAFIFAVSLSALITYFHSFGGLAWLSLTVVFWVIFLSMTDWFRKVSSGTKGIIPRARQLPRQYYGMLIAHLGIVVTLVGILLVTINSHERMFRLGPGDSVHVANYEFHFDHIEQVKGPNYLSDKAQFSVYQGGQLVEKLYPEKRLFITRQQVMTEAALDAGFTRDLYLSLGERLDQSEDWGVRVYVKSFVRWIWLGGLLMMLGGLLAAFDKRYKRRIVR